MPTSLAELDRDLGRALAAGDLERASSIRRTIGDGFADSALGAEANFKLGLTLLAGGEEIESAIDRFRKAAQAKQHPWSPQARITLAQVLFRGGRAQQATFELRKVAGATPPTIMSAVALGFLVLFQREQGQIEAAERSRVQHVKMLEGLTQHADPDQRAYAQYLLAEELAHQKHVAAARTWFEKALASGKLGEPERARAEQFLAQQKY